MHVINDKNSYHHFSTYNYGFLYSQTTFNKLKFPNKMKLPKNFLIRQTDQIFCWMTIGFVPDWLPITTLNCCQQTNVCPMLLVIWIKNSTDNGMDQFQFTFAAKVCQFNATYRNWESGVNSHPFHLLTTSFFSLSNV